jgi:hypothetical protein
LRRFLQRVTAIPRDSNRLGDVTLESPVGLHPDALLPDRLRESIYLSAGRGGRLMAADCLSWPVAVALRVSDG